MNGKLSSELPHENSDKVEILNPFVHHLELETTFDKIKTAICTIILLPIRVAIICFLLISGWLLACIGLWGLTEKDLQNQPVTGWRSKVRFVASHIILWMFTAGGFRIKVRGKQLKRSKAPVVALAPHSSFMDSLAMVYMGGPSIVAKGETASIPFFGSMFSLLNIAVKLTPILCFLGKSTYAAGGMYVIIKGKQATRKEAPILVIAPHSTFLDGGIVYATGFPSIIVRRESGTNPYIGKLINFTQPIYVWRDDPDSRQKTIKEIINRATSELDWPQILIFPEGTCTNRSCLITFKPGAFYPGVPIQPVCIRYPNKLDTVTWTWEGPSALKLLWLTLTQVYSYCEIEFLPVYVPNEEEKRDPKLFANNVRAVMARALGVPVSDYTYDDCRLMAKAKEMNLPNAISLVEVQKLRHKLRLDENNIEENIVNSQLMCKDCSRITLTEFTNYLNLPINDASVHQLFKIYDKNCAGVIDFREYLLGVLALSNNRSVLDILKLACKVYDSSGVGRLSAKDFTKVLFHTLAMHEDTSLEIFRQIDSSKLGYITFENFKSYAEKRAEFSHLFTMKKVDNFKPHNGEICPNEYNKKID